MGPSVNKSTTKVSVQLQESVVHSHRSQEPQKSERANHHFTVDLRDCSKRARQLKPTWIDVFSDADSESPPMT